MKAGAFGKKPTRREVQPGARVLPTSVNTTDSLLSSWGASGGGGSGRLAAATGGRTRSSTLGGGSGESRGRIPVADTPAMSRARTLGLKRAPRTPSPSSSPERSRSPSAPRFTSRSRAQSRARSYRDDSPSPPRPTRTVTRSTGYPSPPSLRDRRRVDESDSASEDDRYGRSRSRTRERERDRSHSRPPPDRAPSRAASRPASRVRSHSRSASQPYADPAPAAAAPAPAPTQPTVEEARPTTLFGSLWGKASQVLASATGANADGMQVKEAPPGRQDSLQRHKELGVPDARIVPFSLKDGEEESEESEDEGPGKARREPSREAQTPEQSTLRNTRPLSLPPSAIHPSASFVSATLLQKSTSEPRRQPLASHSLPASSAHSTVEPITWHRPPPLHPRDHSVPLVPRRGQYSSSAAVTPFDWLEPVDQSPLDPFLFHRDPKRAATRKVRTRMAMGGATAAMGAGMVQRPGMPMGMRTDPGPALGQRYGQPPPQPNAGPSVDPRYLAHQQHQQEQARQHALAMAQYQQQRAAYDAQMLVYQQQLAAAAATPPAAHAPPAAVTLVQPVSLAPSSLAAPVAAPAATAFYSPALASILTTGAPTVASPAPMHAAQLPWPVMSTLPALAPPTTTPTPPAAPTALVPVAVAAPNPPALSPPPPAPQPPIPPTSPEPPRAPTAPLNPSSPQPSLSPAPPTIRSPPIPPSSSMPPNMQQLLQELSQAQAVGVPLPASPAPPATGGGGARGLSLRVEQGLLAPPSAEEQEAAGIVLTPPTPVEPRAGVIGGEVAGEGTPSGLPSAVEEKQEEDEDGEEEEEEEELAPAQVLPPLELEWSLPDLGIGLGFGDDAEAPRSALVAPESFFSSLGLGGAGSLLEKEKEKVEGEGGAKVGKEELPFPVRRPFEEEEEDEDDEDNSDDPTSLEAAFAATTSFISNFREEQVPPPVDSNHASRMTKWLEQQGVEAPKGMHEVMGPPLPPVRPASVVRRDEQKQAGDEDDNGSVNSMEQNVGRASPTPPPQPFTALAGFYRPRTAPPASLSAPAPSTVVSTARLSPSPALSLPIPPPAPPSLSSRPLSFLNMSSNRIHEADIEETDDVPSPTGAAFDLSPPSTRESALGRARAVAATGGPSLVFGGSVVGEAMPSPAVRPLPAPKSPSPSPRPALPAIPRLGLELGGQERKKVEGNAALSKLSNSAFAGESTSVGGATEQKKEEVVESPKLDVGYDLFANW